MIEPKSITELKPGSNYLIVYNRGDMSPASVRALSKELSSLVGALGASATLVVVPDGCSVEVSEVPSSAEVLALLRSVEWSVVTLSYGRKENRTCPVCKNFDPSQGGLSRGHAADCALDAMIKRLGLMPSFAVKDGP